MAERANRPGDHCGAGHAGAVQRVRAAHADYVVGRAAASANPDQVKAAAPGTRLAAALAAWEVQAHRTLAADPDPADPVRVARVQAPITSTTDIVTEAAARKGHIDGDILQRLAPALEASQVAWSRAAKRWAELTSPASRTDPSPDRRSQRSPGRDRCHRHRPKRMGHTRAARKPSRPSQNGQGHSSQHGRIDRHRLRRPRHRGRPPRSHRSRAHHRAEVPRGSRDRDRARRDPLRRCHLDHTPPTRD
jgi:hypothetical protein